MTAVRYRHTGHDTWDATTAAWTHGYDLTQPAQRRLFREVVAAQTARLSVGLICQIADHLGAHNPPAARAEALRALADLVITRWLVAHRGARFDHGHVSRPLGRTDQCG
jgi:hypothetical protein